MQRPRIVEYRGKWEAYVRLNGTSNRFSLGNLAATPENYPAAERALEDLNRQLAAEVTVTISDIVKAYLNASEAISKERMNDAWKALRPFWGSLLPEHITKAKCADYIARRQTLGRQPATIRKELSVLRAAVNWAKKGGEAVFFMPMPPPPKERWLTRNEFKSLLTAAEGMPHLVLFLHLAIGTAGRKEALLEMRWSQVNFLHSHIALGMKDGGKPRATVPITATLNCVLQEALGRRQTEFVVEFAGKPIRSIRGAFEGAAQRAGLGKDVTPHVLRHTAAVWMAAADVSMAKIAQYLGHSDSRITERVYARFSPSHLREAASALELL